MEPDREAQMESDFEAFRAGFMSEFAAAIVSSLSSELHDVDISMAPLARKPKVEFMSAMMRTDLGSSFVKPAFHGTSRHNFLGICAEGFLIAGDGNSLPIVNGRTDGDGIYTVNITAPWLVIDRGRFGPGRVGRFIRDFPSPRVKLFICAVLQSSSTRHVRDAQVIADRTHVSPLAIASGTIIDQPSRRELVGREPEGVIGRDCYGIGKVLLDIDAAVADGHGVMSELRWHPSFGFVTRADMFYMMPESRAAGAWRNLSPIQAISYSDSSGPVIHLDLSGGRVAH